eukprot:6189092-Pleurochrysis_carterae.AAC.4
MCVLACDPQQRRWPCRWRWRTDTVGTCTLSPCHHPPQRTATAETLTVGQLLYQLQALLHQLLDVSLAVSLAVTLAVDLAVNLVINHVVDQRAVVRYRRDDQCVKGAVVLRETQRRRRLMVRTPLLDLQNALSVQADDARVDPDVPLHDLLGRLELAVERRILASLLLDTLADPVAKAALA